MGKKNRRGGGGSVASGATGGGKSLGGGRGGGSQSTAQQQQRGSAATWTTSRADEDPYSLYSWLKHERSAPYYILSFVLVGFLIGLGIGTGYVTNAVSVVPGLGALSSTNPSQTRWRAALGRSVRSSVAYGLVYGRRGSDDLVQRRRQQQPMVNLPEANEFRADGSSPSSPPTAQPSAATSVSDSATARPEPSPSPSAAAGGSPKSSPQTASARGRGGFLSNLFSSSTTYAHDSQRAFAVLREMVVREGGFVHPDLGFLNPAPVGAERGIGMVRDTYDNCQRRCSPGTVENYKDLQVETAYMERYWQTNMTEEDREDRYYEGKQFVFYHEDDPSREEHLTWEEMTPSQRKVAMEYPNEHGPLFHGHDELPKQRVRWTQTEVLLKIPLSIQMTRDVALETLGPLLPPDVARRAPLEELDDGIILALLLSHERGLGRDSLWYPYIATLPPDPLCGYWPLYRPAAFDAITTLGLDIGLDVNSWPGEILKASDHADRMARALNADYGRFLQPVYGETSYDSIRWSLCQVFSRAVGGHSQYGNLRLIPVLDMVNHYLHASPSHELDGYESYDHEGKSAHDFSDWVDAEESDAGAFVLRNTLYGKHKPLRKGQELLVNYNVPHYSPLDWFINLGFVPRERMQRWERLQPAFETHQRWEPKMTHRKRQATGTSTKDDGAQASAEDRASGKWMHPSILGDGSSKDSEATSKPKTILVSSAPGGEPPRRIAISTLDPSHDTLVRFLPQLKEEKPKGIGEPFVTSLIERYLSGSEEGRGELAEEVFKRTETILREIPEDASRNSEVQRKMQQLEQLQDEFVRVKANKRLKEQRKVD
jgi:hypothetical protein